MSVKRIDIDGIFGGLVQNQRYELLGGMTPFSYLEAGRRLIIKLYAVAINSIFLGIKSLLQVKLKAGSFDNNAIQNTKKTRVSVSRLSSAELNTR